MKGTMNLLTYCHKCVYCEKYNSVYECVYNIEEHTSIPLTIIIPDTYSFSCKHFKEKGE